MITQDTFNLKLLYSSNNQEGFIIDDTFQHPIFNNKFIYIEDFKSQT